jgi:hypothetical protein
VPAYLDVVVGGPTFRRRRVRDVRQLQQKIAQLRLHVVELPLEILLLVAEPRHFAEQRRRVLAAPLGDADLLRERVALRLQLLRAGLDALALALERLEAGRVERKRRASRARLRRREDRCAMR